jgi:hypothetical protein
MKLNILLVLTFGAIFSACRAALSYPMSLVAGFASTNGWAHSRVRRLGHVIRTRLIVL